MSTGGLDTSWYFEYAPNTDTFCTSGGTSGTPTQTQMQIVTANNDQEVSANVSGLTGGEKYCYQLVASNNQPPASDGGILTFISGQPTADTSGGVNPTGAQTATVSGEVDPVGQTTTAEVDYDTANSPFCQSGGSTDNATNKSTPQTVSPADDNYHPVTLSIGGLTAGTQYCAEIVARNTSGVGMTGDAVTFTAGVPIVSTDQFDNPTATSGSQANVTGEVDPVGQQTSYWVAYDTAASTWCLNSGTVGSPTFTTTPVPLGAQDAQSHSVTAMVSGLTPGDSYCMELVAQNASGTVEGSPPIPFTAGVPFANTFSAQSTGASTATVSGDVNPSSQSTTYFAQYDLANSTWCQNGGTAGNPSFSTTPQVLPVTDSTFHDVSVNLSALTASDSYCVQIVAQNASGTAPGGIVTFTAGLALVDTSSARATAATAATVFGDVNPSGQSTTYWSVYDLMNSTWCQNGGSVGAPSFSTSPQLLSAVDSSSHPVSVNLTGLTAGAAYCAEIVAKNASGTVDGSPPAPVQQPLPTVFSGTATATGGATETITATVNPNGLSTTYQFQYDLSSSTWCQSGGTAGSPTFSTTSQSAGSGTADEGEQAMLTSLTPGQTYCWQLTATDSAGTASTGTSTFLAGLPSAATDAATGVSGTGATLNGTVNPEGNSTGYHFNWDVNSSQWCSSSGQQGSPANSTTVTPVPQTNTTAQSVSATLTGLTSGQTFCFQVVASNQAGDSSGQLLMFTTTPPASAPTVVTMAATGLSMTGATLNGTVNPNGEQVTDCHFDYGTTAQYGSTIPCSQVVGSGTGAVSVSAALSSLVSGTTYYFRLDATNGTGTTDATGLQFTTTSVTTALLTVSRTGTGAGSVTSSPSGISCPATCANSFAIGTTVTLHETPASGSKFAGWSGACTGTGACSVALSANKSVTAKFTKLPKCTLTPVAKERNGKLTVIAKCSQAVTGTLTGSLIEKPKTGLKKTFPLGPVHKAIAANTNTALLVTMPAAAVTALKQGATESATLALAYSNANGSGRVTASISRITM